MKLYALMLITLTSSEPAVSDVFSVPISDLIMSVEYGSVGRFALKEYTSEDTHSICIAMPYARPRIYDEILGNTSVRDTGIFPIDPPDVYLFYIDSEQRVISFENLATKLSGNYWGGIEKSSKSACGLVENVSLIIDRARENPVPAITMEIN